ncbi:glucose-6-phosphate exchanger SLC37A4 [Nematostella vectensis]|uniref:glucose-6-phosphate exchanger SLC37A4 n=1 Tax=Nematostella vectensis TaxID=45351 RepID=UPI0020770AFF|nr:glucose-6-phosphate exchanger SLC37A4 [Nematostella vectensis]
MAVQETAIYNKTKWKVFICLLVGYSTYYLTRKSFTYTMPSLVRELDVQKSDLGVITSSYTISYGLSKFAGGVLCDKINARTLFVGGLVLSAVLNIAFGYSSSLWSFTIFWSVNGMAQGFGWPPCAKLLKAWFKPFEVGTLWSLLTAGCNLAASLSPLFTTYLITSHGWRSAFTIPGAVALCTSLVLYLFIYNDPSERGLAQASEEVSKQGRTITPAPEGLISSVLTSPFLWMISLGNLATSLIKFAIADWGQLFLMQDKGQTQYSAGLAMSMFEVGGFIGSITSGFFSDWLVLKYNNTSSSSPRIPLVLVYSIGLTASLHLLRTIKASEMIIYLLVFSIGCTAYGPFNMYGVLAIENAPPGLTSTTHAVVALAASSGGVMAGYPLSLIVKEYDWKTALLVLECAAIGAVTLLAFARNTSRHMVPAITDTSKTSKRDEDVLYSQKKK